MMQKHHCLELVMPIAETAIMFYCTKHDQDTAGRAA